MKCVITKKALQTVIDVDGKTVYPAAYMTYNPLKENFDAFKKNGVKMFMFPIYAGDQSINPQSGIRPICDNIFKGYGNYNFSYVEKVLNMLDPTGKEELYLVPRVCLEPPKWWQKLNPDEVSRDFRGEPLQGCFSSEKWRRDMTVVLKALIDFLDNSKWKNQIIGYHIAAGGTEEWTYQSRYDQQYYDYSQTNLAAYRAFLKNKYKTTLQLSEAWRRPIASWEKICFPTPIARTYAQHGFLRKPESELPVLDYYDFHNEIVAETIIYFCRQVKEYTNGERITGAFYGYVFQLPHNKKGLHALETVLRSPYIDFISTTNIGISIGQPWVFASTVQSALLHGKMWIAEGDIRTCNTKMMRETMPNVAPDNDYYDNPAWNGPKTVELSCWNLSKALSRILTTPCGIWWFDMWGGWFNDPAMMKVISQTEPMMRQQKNDFFKAEIAVIVDEKGYKYYGIDEIKMRDALFELGRTLSQAGAPFHIYLQSDLTNADFPCDDYKLFAFVGGVNPSGEEKLSIESRLKKSGKTLLWLHAASFFDSKLCDFQLIERNLEFAERANFEGTEYPENPLPTLQFAEENGYVLSRFTNGEAAVIWRDMGDYNSVYSLQLAPSPELLRHILLLSGVHLFNRAGDYIYAGGEFVAIHAMKEGYRKVYLPRAEFHAFNALTGQELAVNDMMINLHMKQYETIIIHLECNC